MSARKRGQAEMDPVLASILEDIDEDEGKPRSDGKQTRAPGPSRPREVRQAGDTVLAEALAFAVSRVGRVERATHGFHTYPANLHPDLAKTVIGECPGVSVHDPFCGGGTVPVEAILAGRVATGSDLSPIAVLVSRARTANPALATPMRSAARKLAERARLRIDTKIPDAAVEWYQEHVACELGRLRDGISEVEDPAVRNLLRAVLSSVVVKVSYRESDTSNSRVTHHRDPGSTAILFHKKARELGRLLETMPTDAQVTIKEGDARLLAPPEEVGLILTSPPYPGVYDYLPMQQLRYAWLGIPTPSGMAHEVASRRSFRSLGRAEAFRIWREDNAAWITRQARALPKGGRFAIVVGDGLVGDRPVDALSPTVEALVAAGLKVIARASADRPDHARRTIRIEHLVMAERMGS